MRLSILIPTHGRPVAIERCLDHLTPQCASRDLEIIVGLDGPATLTPDPAVPEGLRDIVRLLRLPRSGIIRVRRALLDAARAPLVLWLNDDAWATDGLVDAHLALHDASPAPRVVGGAASWRPLPEPDLFDHLVQQTDLIFFRPVAPHGDAPYRVDYRNVFGLNMSFPRDLARLAGGVPDLPETYGYDDTELAFRLQGAGAEIWHAPRAAVIHDHRYRPEDVHRREYLLGRAAWHYAHANPAFAAALFRRDITASRELEGIRHALRLDRRDAQRIEHSFLDLPRHPPDALSDNLLPLLAEHWVLLKRYLWRWGLSDAAAGRPSGWTLLRDLHSAPGEDPLGAK